MVNEHKRQKKLERKRRKREDKRRVLPTQVPPSLRQSLEQRLDTTKMSVVLKKVAEPLLEVLPERRQRSDVLTVMRLAMLAWDTSVMFAPEELDKALEKLSREVFRSDEAMREIALPLLQLLVARKRKLFPDDDRFVMDVEVREEEDEFRIVAVSQQWPH
jgi:hypothetical protein